MPTYEASISEGVKGGDSYARYKDAFAPKDLFSEWLYRKSIPITGSVGAGTGYQMPVTAHFQEHYITGQADGYVLHPFCQPSSAYYNGRTYVVFQGPKTTGDGDPYITYYDHSTSKWATPIRIAANPLPEEDMHGAPCLLIRTDTGHVGKILVAFGGHNNNYIQWVESTNSEDITEWGTPANLGQGSFPNLVQVSGGDIYCFYRTHGSTDTRYLGYRKMAAGGASWGSEVDMLNWSGGGGTTACEILSAQLAYDSANGIIYTTIAQYDTGGDPVDQWVFGLRLSDGKVVDVAGNAFTVPVSKSDFDSGSYKFKIYTITGSERTYPGAIVLDSSNYPHVVFGGFDGTDTYWLKYTKWTGSSWSSPTTIRSSTGTAQQQYTPALILHSTSDIDLFLTDEEADIEEWNFNGTSWGKVQTVLDISEEVSGISSAVFPSIPAGQTSPIRVIFAGRKTGYENERVYAFGDSDFIPFVAPGFVTLDGHGSYTDFRDIRFTDNDGETLLPYWIEKKDDGNFAKLWVKVAADLDSSQSIYCYYNNLAASSVSDGEATFVAWDDFDTGYDLEDPPKASRGWVVTNKGGADILEIAADPDDATNKVLRYKEDGGGGSVMMLDNDFAQQLHCVIHCRFRHQTRNYAVYTLVYDKDDMQSRITLRSYVSESWEFTWYDGATYNSYSPAWTPSAATWYEFDMICESDDHILKVDGYSKIGDVRDSGDGYDRFRIYANASYVDEFYLDSFFVRKWIDPEPEWGVQGAEEISPTMDGVSAGESLGVTMEWNPSITDGEKSGETLARFIQTQRSISEGSKLGDTHASYITYAIEVDNAKHIHAVDSPEIEQIITNLIGKVDVDLPVLTCQAKSAARLDASLPMPSVMAIANKGGVGLLDIDLPVIDIDATAYPENTGSLDSILPLPILYARAGSTGRFYNFILRYSRGL